MTTISCSLLYPGSMELDGTVMKTIGHQPLTPTSCRRPYPGDNVRMLARSFSVPGDHVGQASTGYRWPFGPVAIVSPFNFPLGEQASNSAISVCFYSTRVW